MAAEAPSKAFRARIDLDDHEVLRVQRYTTTSCALHAMFYSERGTTILIGLRDTARSSASFARSLRWVLHRIGVSVAQALRGKRCSLISEREAVSLCVVATLVIPRDPSHTETTTAGAQEARIVNLSR